jgi:hypothetical protein
MNEKNIKIKIKSSHNHPTLTSFKNKCRVQSPFDSWAAEMLSKDNGKMKWCKTKFLAERRKEKEQLLLLLQLLPITLRMDAALLFVDHSKTDAPNSTFLFFSSSSSSSSRILSSQQRHLS